MIKKKDVIRLKIPYPDISSQLAAESHMYLCQDVKGDKVTFVKCQSEKPYMTKDHPIKRYVREKPDVNRNPFKRTTRIDCDKVFTTTGVEYEDSLKTSIRPDVSDDVMQEVDRKINSHSPKQVPLDEEGLVRLNSGVKKKKK